MQDKYLNEFRMEMNKVINNMKKKEREQLNEIQEL